MNIVHVSICVLLFNNIIPASALRRVPITKTRSPRKCDEEFETSLECSRDVTSKLRKSPEIDHYQPNIKSNPSFRYNHVCMGEKYNLWLRTNAADLESWKNTVKASSVQLKGGILLLGNSHTGEVYEALLDSLADNIQKFEVTEFQHKYYKKMNDKNKNNALHAECKNPMPYPDEPTLDEYPLVERRFGIDQTDSRPLENVTYTLEYSRTTLKNRAKISTAFNTRLLYAGENGLDKIIAHLNVDLSQLDAIVIGRFNDLWWERSCFSNHKDPVIWEDHNLIKALYKRGFRGRVMLWGMFGGKSPEMPQEKVLPISVIPDPIHTYRNIAVCSAGTQCGDVPYDHQCIPGIPNAVAAMLSTNLLQLTQ